jgi:hypothetical protein
LVKKKVIAKAANRPLRAPEDEVRLVRLERALVSLCTHAATPFAQILSLSNPGTGEILAYPALQFWWESYSTRSREAIAGVLRLTQDVLFGSNILVSTTDEEDARYMTFTLQEEVERRIIGAMPNLGPDTEVVFPIADEEAQFVKLEGSGLFVFNVMYTLTWVTSKGAKDA